MAEICDKLARIYVLHYFCWYRTTTKFTSKNGGKFVTN